ncbi:hypothetical protein HK099_005254 [Clydaea vesicula]|uniref:BHLH domain-containing protein n=1 Tax=Clydaea vesicula TaxID=447962 RepID=A0AAD5UC07_9FUNG|nr:hypothetical protein HK099_005254 [Clydaea vesicula]
MKNHYNVKEDGTYAVSSSETALNVINDKYYFNNPVGYINTQMLPQYLSQDLLQPSTMQEKIKHLNPLEIEELKLKKEEIELQLKLQQNLQNQNNLKKMIFENKEKDMKGVFSDFNFSEKNLMDQTIDQPLTASLFFNYDQKIVADEAVNFSSAVSDESEGVAEGNIKLFDEMNVINNYKKNGETKVESSKEAERIRRENLRGGFEELRQVLTIKDNKHFSKQQLLMHACKEINEIKKKELETFTLIKNLRKEFNAKKCSVSI